MHKLISAHIAMGDLPQAKDFFKVPVHKNSVIFYTSDSIFLDDNISSRCFTVGKYSYIVIFDRTDNVDMDRYTEFIDYINLAEDYNDK